MSIPTYRPDFTVRVYKTVTRADAGQPQRLTGGQVWDITPYLGDDSDISVSKSLLSPKGSFIITVPDQPFTVAPAFGAKTDTLYGLLEPMDEIEIRLARSRADYGGALPLLMRGFIRSIRRTETMGMNGRPQRRVIIQGNDYGFIFEMVQMPPLVYLQYGLGITWNNPWEAMLAIGENQQPRPVGEFFQLMLTHLINTHLQVMKARFTAIPLDQSRQSDGQPVKGTVVMPSQDQLLGSIWNLFRQWADIPWNELWVEDPFTLGDEPPRLCFRTAPYRTWIKEGQIMAEGETLAITGQTATYDTVALTIDDVISLDASRSENDVANIYWVHSPVLGNQQTISAEMGAAAATETGANGLPRYLLTKGDDTPNSDPELYGYRVMELHSVLLPDLTSGLQGQSEQTLNAAGGLYREWPDWAMLRRKALVEMNSDNVLLEDGSLIVKGDERIRAGVYVSLRRGALGAEYYAQTVTHRFAPYRQYTTAIQFIRGTGFIERVRSTESPFLQEGKQGVYFPRPLLEAGS